MIIDQHFENIFVDFHCLWFERMWWEIPPAKHPLYRWRSWPFDCVEIFQSQTTRRNRFWKAIALLLVPQALPDVPAVLIVITFVNLSLIARSASTGRPARHCPSLSDNARDIDTGRNAITPRSCLIIHLTYLISKTHISTRRRKKRWCCEILLIWK